MEILYENAKSNRSDHCTLTVSYEFDKKEGENFCTFFVNYTINKSTSQNFTDPGQKYGVLMQDAQVSEAGVLNLANAKVIAVQSLSKIEDKKGTQNFSINFVFQKGKEAVNYKDVTFLIADYPQKIGESLQGSSNSTYSWTGQKGSNVGSSRTGYKTLKSGISVGVGYSTPTTPKIVLSANKIVGDRIKKGSDITISLNGGSSATGQTIVKYELYRKYNSLPTNSSYGELVGTFSGEKGNKIVLTCAAEEGTIYYFSARAIGQYSNSSLSTPVTCRISRVPEAPQVTLNQNDFISSNSSITAKVKSIVARHPDGGSLVYKVSAQPQSISPSPDSCDSGKDLVVTNDSIGTTREQTYYFWAYEEELGLAGKVTTLTVKFTRQGNVAPPHVTLKIEGNQNYSSNGINYSHSYKLTAAGNGNNSGDLYSFYLMNNTQGWAKRISGDSPTSNKQITCNLANYGVKRGDYFYFSVYYHRAKSGGGYEDSAPATSAVVSIPSFPSFQCYTKADKTPGDFFDSDLYVYFSEDSYFNTNNLFTIRVDGYSFSSSINFESKKIKIIPNNVAYGAVVNLQVTLKDQVLNESKTYTFKKTRIKEVKMTYQGGCFEQISSGQKTGLDEFLRLKPHSAASVDLQYKFLGKIGDGSESPEEYGIKEGSIKFFIEYSQKQPYEFDSFSLKKGGNLFYSPIITSKMYKDYLENNSFHDVLGGYKGAWSGFKMYMKWTDLFAGGEKSLYLGNIIMDFREEILEVEVSSPYLGITEEKNSNSEINLIRKGIYFIVDSIEIKTYTKPTENSSISLHFYEENSGLSLYVPTIKNINDNLLPEIGKIYDIKIENFSQQCTSDLKQSGYFSIKLEANQSGYNKKSETASYYFCKQLRPKKEDLFLRGNVKKIKTSDGDESRDVSLTFSLNTNMAFPSKFENSEITSNYGKLPKYKIKLELKSNSGISLADTSTIINSEEHEEKFSYSNPILIENENFITQLIENKKMAVKIVVSIINIEPLDDKETSYIEIYTDSIEETYTFYDLVPTISYRKNQIGINYELPNEEGDDLESNAQIIIGKPAENKDLILFSDKTGSFVEIRGFFINCGYVIGH